MGTQYYNINAFVFILAQYTLAFGPHYPQIKAGYLATLTYSDGTPCDWGLDSYHATLLALDMYPGVNVTSDMVVDTQCNPENVANATMMLLNKGAQVIIGPDCSQPAEIALNTIIGNAQNGEPLVPLVSAGSNARSLSNSTKFPNFLRIVPGTTNFEGTLIAVLQRYGFSSFAIASTTDAFGQDGGDVYEEFGTAANMTVLKRESFARNSSHDVLYSAMQSIKSTGAKVIMLSMPVPDTAAVFTVCGELNMTANHSYYFFGNEPLGEESSQRAPAVAAYNHFTLLPDAYPSQMLSTFLQDFRSKYSHTPDLWGIFAYDVVALISKGCEAISKGEKLLPSLRAVNFYGITGQISFEDGTNNRKFTRLVYMNLQGSNTTNKQDYVTVGRYEMDAKVHVYQNEAVSPTCA
eukprot:m.113182 g.113182  ORF g.113182 m.113182 type:complete len:407 (-) comp14122_c0_seq5:3099-4319(-)